MVLQPSAVAHGLARIALHQDVDLVAVDLHGWPVSVWEEMHVIGLA
jgi:hypothetical protein